MYNLPNDTVSNSHCSLWYPAVGSLVNLRCGRKRSYRGICVEELRTTTKFCSQDRDSNSAVNSTAACATFRSAGV